MVWNTRLIAATIRSIGRGGGEKSIRNAIARRVLSDAMIRRP